MMDFALLGIQCCFWLLKVGIDSQLPYSYLAAMQSSCFSGRIWSMTMSR